MFQSGGLGPQAITHPGSASTVRDIHGIHALWSNHAFFRGEDMAQAPKLISLNHKLPEMSLQGQPMVPLVSADVEDTQSALASAGVVQMRPVHAARSHRHK